MNLPESVLLCLFPNGLVLSRQGGYGGDGEDDDEEEVYGVDYDPECFRYVLEFWSTAHNQFYSTSSNSPHSQSLYAAQQFLLSGGGSLDYNQQMNLGGPGNIDNPLITKQPIIVLREELEYFAIPPPSSSAGKGGGDGVGSSGLTGKGPGGASPTTGVGGRISNASHPLAHAQTTMTGQPTTALTRLKKEAGRALLDRKKVFTALQRNVSKEGNLAEQHLIDMLCMSGFSRDDTWGYRAIEPTRCCISSIALVLLKTGISHQSFESMDKSSNQQGHPQVSVDQQQMATAQKLLLFWRKPARKCWWDGVEVDVPVEDGSNQTANVKVWARRVWTLELSLI